MKIIRRKGIIEKHFIPDRMKYFYPLIFLFCFFFLFIPVAGYSSHIVGGSLTYAYGGANTYTITLKLYRDCDAGVDFSATALIQVQQADGSEFSPSRDITLPTISTSTVAAVPPPCSTPPVTPPCVAERIYRLVVVLAPSPGGMHLFHQVCCRNASITNISGSSSDGESFYAFIPCYNSTWVEDFTLANATTTDAGATAWTRTLGVTPPTSAQVNNGQFEVSGANGVNIWLEDFPVNGVTSDVGPTAWTRTVTAGVVGVTVANQFQAQGAGAGTMTFATQTVSIAAYPLGVNLSVDLSDGGTMEPTDVITVSYSIDGAAPVQFPINGSIADDFPASPIIAEATGLVGNNIQIIVSVVYSATSPASEVYNIDNVLIYSPATAVWTSQVIGIAAYPSGVNLSANLSEASTLEPSDNIIMSYSLDGGAPVVFPANGSLFNDFGSAFATVTGLAGTTIQIFATVRYGAVSAGEIYNIDMVSVYDNTFLVNSNPVFNLVPPLYFCQTYADTIDYSATDVDGDVLVYSFYTPYENASPCCGPYPAPTYSNNIASFSTVTWQAGYSATSPLNSGGPALNIDAAGEVSGVANSLGNYVFGVKVQEFRGAILLGETTRGYQVEVIVCAPFVPPAPTTGTDNPVPICTGQTISLTASTVVGATGYTWNGPNGFSSSVQNPTIPSVTTAASGTYSVYASVAGCNGAIGTVSITVNPTPATPIAGSNSTVCSGQTLSLTSNTVGGTTYNWNGPNSFTSTLEDPTIPAVTAADAGTYTVTRTSAVGCVSAAATAVVAVNLTPTVTVSSNATICNGSSTTLTVSGATTYAWSPATGLSSTIISNPVANPTTTTTYSVTGTTGGCVSSSRTVTVTVNSIPAAPTPVSSNSPICVNTTLNLFSANNPSATYSWTGPNSYTATVEDPSFVASTTAYTGTYSVTVTVAGCTSSTATTSVTVNPIPAAATGVTSNQPVCVGSNLSLVCDPVGGATYSWTGPNSYTGTGSSPFFNASTTAYTGTYSVTVTVAGCTGPAGTTSVTIVAAPTVSAAGADQTGAATCGLTSVTLAGNAPAVGTGAWSIISGAGGTVVTPTSPTSVFNGVAGTTYVLRWTISNAPCTASADDVTITFNQSPVITAGSNGPVCQGNEISLTATNVAGATYSWNGPSGFTSALEDPTIPGASTAHSGTYTVTATSAIGCVTNAVHTLTVTPTITVATGADQTVCANNGTTSLAGTVSGGTTTGIWTTSGSGGFVPGATNLSTNYIPSNADTAAGTITLTLTSTNNGGCTSQNDALILTITDGPVVNAGADQTVCANNADVALSGSVNSAATGGLWATSGSGIFSPDNLTLGATYIPSASDTTAGTVTLTLTTTGIGSCSPVSDAMVVTIIDAPRVNAGVTISVCSNNPNAPLNGSSTTGTAIWTTVGTGTFSPTATTLNATYVPTAGDISGGSIDLILTTTGNGLCNSEDDTVTVVFTAPPTVSVGPDQTVCANNNVVTISGTSSTGTGQWSSSGTGIFGNATSLTTTYTSSAADNSSGSVTLTFITTNNGGCLGVADQMTITITPAPTANAGVDQTVCANNPDVTLSGAFTVATGGIWSSSGTGIFSPDNVTMGATYAPSAADTLAGTVTLVLTTTGNGLCNAVTDTMVITITVTPAVNAGINTVACKNNPNVPLNGTSSTGAGIWTIVPGMGTGTFVPNNTTLSATYSTTPADTTAGTVMLILTSTGNGICLSEDDTITITYIDKPIVNAGPDQTVCTNNPNFAISGTSNTGSGIWTTAGTGTFTPSATLLNTNYSPSAADLAAGTITLYLTSTNNGTCLPVKDTMVVTISPAPTSNAGADQTVCANNAIVTLSGSFTVSTGGGWTTLGGGTFSPDTFSMIVTYTPSPADTAAGSDTIIFTTTGNGNCLAVSDTMIITITDAPVVNAGPNQFVCIANPVAVLNGTSTTGNGSWTTLGSGTFGNSALLATTYTASAGDIGAGNVTLVLESTANGLCNPVTDTILLTFVSTPTVTAGADQTVCANADTVSLSGTSTTGSGIWTSSGGGIFSPNNISLITTYIPNATDTVNGTVTIILTSTAGCIPVKDTMIITITPAPEVSAGIDQVVCVGTYTVQLNGSVTSGASTGIWSTSGTGAFTPSNTVMNPVYTLTPADSAAGGVTIYLTSTGNGNCYAETDLMNISVVHPPAVNAGPNQTLCSLPVVFLNGSVTGGSGTGVWSTVNGGGTFVPDSTVLNGMYFPSNSDTAFGGVVTIILTSTNNGNCPPSTDTVLITFYPPPVAFAGADIVICKNNADSIPLNGIVQNVFGSLWTTPGGGTFSPSDTILNPYYHPDSVDFTQDTLIISIQTTPAFCPPAYDTVLIIFTPAPLVNAGANVLVCEGDSIAQLNGSVTGGAITGQWSTLGSGTFSPNDSTLNATYTLSNADTAAGGATLVLTSTNNAGCKPETDTVQIIITPAPIVSAGNDTTVCANNDSIFLNGSVTIGSTTGFWSTSGSGIFLPDSSALNATYVPSNADTTAGTLTLTLTSTNGCKVVSDSLVVTITDAPVVNAGTNISVCEGISVALNGSVSGGAITGQWTTSGNGTFSPNDSTLNATYIPGSNDTSSVTLTLTSTGNGQCLAVSDALVITIGRFPVAGFSVGPICTGSSVLFTDISTVINDTIVAWNWTIDGGNDINQNPSYTYSSAGTDTVILIVTTNIGCTDTVLHVVTINPIPVPSFTFMTSCSVDSVYFTGAASISSGTIASWSWNFGDANTSTLQNPVHSYSASGTFTVTLTVTSDSGCTATFTDTVIPVSGIIAAFADNADCQFNVAFTDASLFSTGDSIILWQWDIDNNGSTDYTSQNPSHPYAGAGSYTVSLIVTSVNGCTDTIAQVITLDPLAVADFVPTSGTYSVGTTVAFTDLSTNAVSWMWNFGDSGTGIVQNPAHTFEVIGTLDVMLIVMNSQGCPDTVKYSFIFNTNIVAVPSAFTPNGDGINDILYVRGGPLKEMNFRVYNEWGNELFRSTSQSDGWDGTYKGKYQPAARYVYILTGTTYGDEEINMQGDATIIR